MEELLYKPITYDEVCHYVNMARNAPRKDAEALQRFLYRRAAETGVCSPEIIAKISSITDRFKDEENEMLRKLMAEDLRRRGIMDQQKIDASDEQIVTAIKLTLPKFESDRDWGGIYRILVDFCNHLGFKAVKTDFVKRFALMGIYPTDKIAKDLVRNVPSAIKGTEWHEHKFSYSAVQKGIDSTWPTSYKEWEESDIINRDFLDRKSIAKIFLDNLIKVTSMP